MKTLAALVRLATLRADTLRRELGELDLQRAAQARAAAAADAAMAREQALAVRDAAAMPAFLAYRRARAGDRAALAAEQAVLDAADTRLRAELGEAFLELKRFETLHEEHVAASARETARREQAALDEAAGLRFQHRRAIGQT